VDVREPSEHDEFNIGGELIPLGKFRRWMSIARSTEDQELILYCRSGNRSIGMSNTGNDGIYEYQNLQGGMPPGKA
jgi:rhodanese-related sulfurtransferase